MNASNDVSFSPPQLFELSQHILLEIRGPDATRYLQGRVTQDIKRLTPGSGAFSLLLTPQGRILGRFYILRLEDSFLLIGDPGTNSDTNLSEETLIKALLQFKVADQVECVSLRDEFRLLSLYAASKLVDPQIIRTEKTAAEKIAHAVIELPSMSLRMGHLSWSFGERFDFLVPKNAVSQACAELTVKFPGFPQTFSAEDSRTLHRIQGAEVEYGIDLDEKVLAPEMPLEDYVSFKKGCYAGQEVVEMAIARGRPNRKLVKITALGQPELTPNTEILSSDGKAVGVIKSTAFDAALGAVVALGFVKTNLEETASLSAAGATLQLTELSSK